MTMPRIRVRRPLRWWLRRAALALVYAGIALLALADAAMLRLLWEVVAWGAR